MVNQMQQGQAGQPVRIPMVHHEGMYVIEIIAFAKNYLHIVLMFVISYK